MVKNPPANIRDASLIPGGGKTPWRKKWQPFPVFLLEKSHGQRSLVGYSPSGCKRVGYDLQLNKQKTKMGLLFFLM